VKPPKGVPDVLGRAKGKTPHAVVVVLGWAAVLLIGLLLWFLLPKTGLPGAAGEAVKTGLAIVLLVLLLAPLALGLLGLLAVAVGPIGYLWRRAGVRTGFAFFIGFGLGALVGSCMVQKGLF
jgi:hypothetical protein